MMRAVGQNATHDALAVIILEECHDFIQTWADGMKMDQASLEKAATLRMQIDMYLGYCPWGEPEKRSDAK